MRRNDHRARMHASYLAFFIHRLSGVALAVFLPLHFLLLGRALQGAEALQSALDWTTGPLFKFAEWGLVFLLAAHLLGGLRLLLIEFKQGGGLRKGLIALSLCAALLLSGLFAWMLVRVSA